MLFIDTVNGELNSANCEGNAQQNGPVEHILFGNPTMTGPPTGGVNGVLSK